MHYNITATRPITYKEVLNVANEANYDSVPGSKYTSSNCTSNSDNTARDTCNYTTASGTAATKDRVTSSPLPARASNPLIRTVATR
jgi:hypothetical protein